MRSGRPAPELDPDANPAAVARSIVLAQLTHAPKSRHQLEQKLSERHIPADVAQAVLDRFELVKLVDDAEFAQEWVRTRSLYKSLARGALRRELAEKGIAAEVAEAALEQVSDDLERAQAQELVERKIRPAMDLTDRAERDKCTRRWVAMLARKGFNPSLAYGIVAEVIDRQAGSS